MRRIARVVLLIAGLALLGAPGAVAGFILEGWDLFQTDFELGAYSQANSDWGLVNVTYSWTEEASLGYFNLVVDGRWEVQNAPLYRNPLSSQHSVSINFNLGNTVGTRVEQVSCIAVVGAQWLDEAPTGAPETVSVSSLAVTVGGRGGPVGPVGPASSWVGSKPGDSAHNWGMLNQDCGVDECAPAAFSNSLQWLSFNHPSLEIPADKMSIDALKGPTKWKAPLLDSEGRPIPGTGGTPLDDWEGKRDAFKDYVTTRKFAASELSKVLFELKQGQDVELLGWRHAAVVESIAVNEDGTYTLWVNHDVQQGTPGGTAQQLVTIDPTTGQFVNSAYGFWKGETIDGFVVECPVPEPVFLQFGALVGLGGLGLLRMRRRA